MGKLKALPVIKVVIKHTASLCFQWDQIRIATVSPEELVSGLNL